MRETRNPLLRTCLLCSCSTNRSKSLCLCALLLFCRDTYDRFGEEGLKRTEQGGSADPFSDIFSQFGFGGGRRQREESRTPNVEVCASVHTLLAHVRGVVIIGCILRRLRRWSEEFPIVCQ